MHSIDISIVIESVHLVNRRWLAQFQPLPQIHTMEAFHGCKIQMAYLSAKENIFERLIGFKAHFWKFIN